ncbi:MAG: aspartate carbamoyltransferase catalytic subunit [Dethiobacteria bacterium]|jgi:aspartate carbamoyltransferase catalytic subunit
MKLKESCRERIALFPKDLFNLQHFSREALEEILNRAEFYKERDGKDTFQALKGKDIALSFWEPSTRTSFSFQQAIHKLGGRVIEFKPEISSVQKGESIEDTIKALLSLGASALVFRHRWPGLFQQIAEKIEIPIISGGEGCYQHPTQALLDLFTLRQTGLDLNGLSVVLVGDILHSRVARSLFYLLPLFGVKLTLVAPPVFLPLELVPPGADYSFNLEDNLPKGDVLYFLRVQKERQESGLLSSLGEYAALYGLNKKRLALLKKDVYIMHPGPVNIGVEISYHALKYLEEKFPQKLLIHKQIQNGVYVRMAVLDLLVGRKV